MAEERKHIINIHTATGVSEPSGASLYLGEIAVQHTPEDPALWIKVGTSEESNVYEKFIGKTEIMNIMNTSNILGSGYTYSGLPYVNSATTIADAYSALTNELIKDEYTISAAFNDVNDRLIALSGAMPDIDLEPLSASVVTNKTDIATLSGIVADDEVVTSAALNDLNARIIEVSAATADIPDVSGLETRLTNVETRVSGLSGDNLFIEGYEVASGSSEQELTLTSGDTISEAFGKIQKQMLDNEETIAASLNDLNSRINTLSGETTDLSEVYEAISGVSGSVSVLSAIMIDNEEIVAASLNDLNDRIIAVSGDVASVVGEVSGVLTINLNGEEKGKYSPSGDTTINLSALTEVTGADVLLTGYEISSGTTEEELVIRATDTVNEAFGKLQKQNYDNEEVVSGAFNDLDGRVIEMSGALATKQDILVAGEGITISGNVISAQATFDDLKQGNTLSFYTTKPVSVVVSAANDDVRTVEFSANTIASVNIKEDDEFVINNPQSGITAVYSWPGVCEKWEDWFDDVQLWSNTIFHFSDGSNTYVDPSHWHGTNQQGRFGVTEAQYKNCIFWDDNPMTNSLGSSPTFILHKTVECPLFYSTIPANTYSFVKEPYNITVNPNWNNPTFLDSFANGPGTARAYQVFSYANQRSIPSATFTDADVVTNVLTLPPNINGLCAYAGAETVGTFDATNVTNWQTGSTNWNSPFIMCYKLKELRIQNLKANLNVSWSPLSYESLNYLVENAANTSPITIQVSSRSYYDIDDALRSAAAAKNITFVCVSGNNKNDVIWEDVADIKDSVSAITSAVSELSSAVTILSGVIEDDELVISAALNNLNGRVTSVSGNLNTNFYTKTEVDNLIGSSSDFHYEIYATTGSVSSPAANVLYLIGPTGTGADKYEEYVYANSTWTKIGDTTIDLAGYATTGSVSSLSAATTGINSTLASHTGNSDIHVTTAQTAAWDAKANTNSPVFSGTPTAPNPSAGDNSTRIATTAFVNSALTSGASALKPAYFASGNTITGGTAIPNGDYTLYLFDENGDEASYPPASEGGYTPLSPVYVRLNYYLSGTTESYTDNTGHTIDLLFMNVTDVTTDQYQSDLYTNWYFQPITLSGKTFELYIEWGVQDRVQLTVSNAQVIRPGNFNVLQNGVLKGTYSTNQDGNTSANIIETQLSTATTGTGNVMTDISVSDHQITKNYGMTIPTWATASTKPSYTASEVGALPTGTTLDNVADGTTRKLSDYATQANFTAHTASTTVHVTTAEKDTWNGKQAEISDLSTIRNNASSGASAYTGVTSLSAATTAMSANVAKIAVTGVTVTGTGNAVTNAAYSDSALTLTKGNVLTAETLTGVSLVGTAVTLSSKVAPIPSASSSAFGVVKTGNFIDNNNGTIAVSTGTTNATVARGDQFLAVSGATTANTGNINTLSGTTQAHTATTIANGTSSQMHLPTVSASDNDKILQVKNGAWSLVTPVSIYTGSGTPSQSLGNDGDIYLQTS